MNFKEIEQMTDEDLQKNYERQKQIDYLKRRKANKAIAKIGLIMLGIILLLVLSLIIFSVITINDAMKSFYELDQTGCFINLLF